MHIFLYGYYCKRLYQIADPMVFEFCRLVCDKLNRDAVKPAKLKF